MSIDIAGWLAAYGAAWEAHDGAAAAELFSEDGVYCWGPFAEPLAGRAAIRDRWNMATAGQGSVRFASQQLGHATGPVIARWQVSLHPPGGADAVELDGIFLLDFAPDGRCARLEEWWMTKPAGDGSTSFDFAAFDRQRGAR